MPIYDCGDPDCSPCKTAFRRKAETMTDTKRHETAVAALRSGLTIALGDSDGFRVRVTQRRFIDLLMGAENRCIDAPEARALAELLNAAADAADPQTKAEAA